MSWNKMNTTGGWSLYHFNFYIAAVGDEIWKSDEAQAYPINAGEEKPMYTGTYTIARLRPATVYMARVSSQNNYGYSHPSEVFKFATRGAGKDDKH